MFLIHKVYLPTIFEKYMLPSMSIFEMILGLPRQFRQNWIDPGNLKTDECRSNVSCKRHKLDIAQSKPGLTTFAEFNKGNLGLDLTLPVTYIYNKKHSEYYLFINFSCSISH